MYLAGNMSRSVKPKRAPVVKLISHKRNTSYVELTSAVSIHFSFQMSVMNNNEGLNGSPLVALYTHSGVASQVLITSAIKKSIKRIQQRVLARYTAIGDSLQRLCAHVDALMAVINERNYMASSSFDDQVFKKPETLHKLKGKSAGKSYFEYPTLLF